MINVLGKRYFNQKEICRMFDLSRSQIYRNEKSGLFPKRIKFSAGKVRWMEADIVAFRESGGKVIKANE